MKLLGTSQINKSLFLLLGAPIISVCYKVVGTQLVIRKAEHVIFLPLISCFLKCLSHIFVVAFELIFCTCKFRARKKRKHSTFSKGKITVLPNTLTNLNFSFPFLAVIFMAVLFFIGDIMQSYLFLNLDLQYKGTGLLMAMIIVTVPSAYFFWGNLIYRHHILAFAILLIGNVFFVLSVWEYNMLDLWFVISYVFQSIRILIEKWALESRNASPFLCLSFQGLIGLGITSIVIYSSSSFDWQYQESFDLLGLLFSDMMTSLLSCSVILMGCFSDVMLILINKSFNPNQVVFTTFISSSLLMLVSIIENHESSDLIIVASGNLIFFFGAVIYNEILIFYCFGLGYNTRKEILQRSKDEINDLNGISLLNITEDNEDNHEEVVIE